MGTIPTFPTLTDGQLVTATNFAAIKAVSDFWALTPRCYAYHSAAASPANNTWTVLALGAEVYDIVQSGDTASHDNSTNPSRVVVRTSGKYEITGQVQFTANGTGDRQAQIRLNAAGNIASGSEVIRSTQSPAAAISTSVSLPVVEMQLSAGDYLELFAFQSSGAALAVLTGASLTFLRMKLTGA